MGTVHGEPLPGTRARERSWRRVVWPRAGQPLVVLCLAEKIFGKYLHYDIKLDRSRPCTAWSGACTYCGENIPCRWMGYEPALNVETREQCIAMVTESAARMIEADPLSNGGLRGKRLLLQRCGKGPTERVEAILVAAQVRDLLVPTFDPEPILARLWGTDGRKGARIVAAQAQGELFYGDGLPAQLPGEEGDDVPF